MKILYFSGTGNSYYIAKKIADSIEGSNLLDISVLFKNSEFHHDDVDDITIVFPVYAFLAPIMVEGFLKFLKIKKGAKVNIISTCGGKNMPANPHIQKIMERKGGNVQLSYVVHMPDNYIPFGGAKSDEIINKAFEEADKKIENIISAIKNNEQGHYENGNLFFRLLSKPLWKFFAIGMLNPINEYHNHSFRKNFQRPGFLKKTYMECKLMKNNKVFGNFYKA